MRPAVAAAALLGLLVPAWVEPAPILISPREDQAVPADLTVLVRAAAGSAPGTFPWKSPIWTRGQEWVTDPFPEAARFPGPTMRCSATIAPTEAKQKKHEQRLQPHPAPGLPGGIAKSKRLHDAPPANPRDPSRGTASRRRMFMYTPEPPRMRPWIVTGKR